MYLFKLYTINTFYTFTIVAVSGAKFEPEKLPINDTYNCLYKMPKRNNKNVLNAMQE